MGGGTGFEGKLENVPNWQNRQTSGDADLRATTLPDGIYLLLFHNLHWKEKWAAGIKIQELYALFSFLMFFP